jgi:hypothetical protein
MQQPTTMAQVFGEQLHWASIVIGLLLAAFGFYIAYDRGASTRATLLTTGVCFLIPYLIGRAALYVLGQ